MGIFGSKKTYVSSTLQNLAGPELDRPSYLKTTVIGNIIANQESVTDTLNRAYLNGPGIKLRRFFNWAKDNYDDIGMPKAKLRFAPELDVNVLKVQVPHTPGKVVRVQIAESGLADYGYWADKWMLENHPDQVDDDWVSDYDETTNKVVVTLADDSEHSFTPTDFQRQAYYIYVTYIEGNTEEEIALGMYSDAKLYIYRLGSGNAALDALVTDQPTDTEAEYLPFIPVRLDNKFLGEINPDEYDLAKKAYRKSVTGKLDDLIAELEDAENLADMDYIYVAFGVSMNVLDNSCRKYLFEFFTRLKENEEESTVLYPDWKADKEVYENDQAAWEAWRSDQDDITSPGWGTSEPDIKSVPAQPTKSIRIKSEGNLNSNFDMEITWTAIDPLDGNGLAKPDAKVGEVWFDLNPSDQFDDKIVTGGKSVLGRVLQIDKVRLYHQVDADNWLALDLTGFVHKNYIYKGKFVEITMREALEDDIESGFLVPLHMPTIKKMSIVDSTQMSTACCFLVFNSYVVKKTGILGSLFFKVFLIALTIVVMVYAPQLAPGLVQAATATGTAIGLSGATALVAGAAVNAIAAMIITNLVFKAAVGIFGPKLGAIIGTIASVVAMNGFVNFQASGQFTINFGNILSASNLTMLTSATGNAIGRVIGANIADIVSKTQEVQAAYEKESKRIADLYAQNFGYGNGVIDPLNLLDGTGFSNETSDSFLTRTLMTGSDIAELSLDMLTHFTDLTLSTELLFD